MGEDPLMVTVTLDGNGKILDCNFVEWIMLEIGDKVYKRQHVADTYAILIQKGHRDFAAINLAIIERWSMGGLQWIKTQAWKHLQGKGLRDGR